MRESSVFNAEALWRAFGSARGHQLIDEPGWLAVDAGEDVGGTRVILRGDLVGAERHASLNRLVDRVSRPVVVEDPFGTLDLRGRGLVSRSLSVMAAGPSSQDAMQLAAAPADGPTDITVRRVENDAARLRDAERVVVEGFPLTSYQPYQPGRLLPVGLLVMPHISTFVADFLGEPAGVCMTVQDAHGVGGVYWVTVLPRHRRAGVGRALMLAAMRELAGKPLVLCATRQGEPVYRQLGFETAFESTWWQTAKPV